ncbi:AMP-binding protein [Bordetella sp. 15P40C-2]|uniref:AMP-binding protein n=1 Tax=Bordetella sp. 15P40C-2 TaxID=2572246 RepID=UPI001323D9F1|nr:AMP-binding protein [Bordetella sp. 15P40C-2]MVW70976.1 AMP-binding protein [Bordetella sp. 15P40C-2]
MTSLSSSVQHWSLADPDRLALVYGHSRISYGELAQRTRAVAGILRGRGIGPGDVVALLMKNSAAFIELTLAIGHLGAVVLPINYRLSADEVDYIVQHARAKLVCVDEELAENVGPAPALVVTPEAQYDARALQPKVEPVTAAHPCTPEDMFRLMYTSGTTARPKGVIHTYQNFYWKTLDHICELGLTRQDRLLVVGPLYHVGAFDLPGMALLLVGGSITVLRDFDAEEVLAAIHAERLTGAWLAPVMLNRLLALRNRGDFDVTSLQWVIGGGERTPAERIQSFKSLFTHGRYIDAYGLTETCSGDTMMQAGKEIEKIGSAGRALAHVDIEIRDQEGRALPAGQIGEICLRGPKVTRGYWQDQQRTEASFFGDWFRSGDMGYLDEDGFLFLVDRKKDMVISGGENIASSEVERVIYQLDIVEEAAVIGLPDEKWGERVVAVVVLRDGASLTLEDLQAHCRGKLGGFKIPKQLIITDALARNPSGKVLKRVLRDQLSQSTS